jgi:hypothetical protein
MSYLYSDDGFYYSREELENSYSPSGNTEATEEKMNNSIRTQQLINK